jgi:hypothetical protein
VARSSSHLAFPAGTEYLCMPIALWDQKHQCRCLNRYKFEYPR